MKVFPYSPPDLARLISADATRSAQMQELWDWIVVDDAKDPDSGRELDAQEGRAQSDRLTRRWNTDLPDMADVERFSLPGPAGAPSMRADMIVPHGAKPGCILYVHGGGWAYCNIDSHQRTLRMLANAAQTRVLGIDYRLAPEHSYPAPLEDVQAAWRWLLARAATDPSLNGPLVIAGDSAGASLALSTILREQELQRTAPDAALLFYGIFSANLESASYLRFATGYGLTRQLMTQFFDWYVPGTSPDSARYDPVINQVAASEAALARLPPLFLNAAGLDVLLCDTLELAARLRQAGTLHELVVHEGVHHGFVQYSAKLAEARRAFDLAGDFYRRLRAASELV